MLITGKKKNQWDWGELVRLARYRIEKNSQNLEELIEFERIDKIWEN